MKTAKELTLSSTETPKLKLLMQTPELRVNPELQLVQVEVEPMQVAQLSVQETQFTIPEKVTELPMMVPLWAATKPGAQVRHMAAEMHWAHPELQATQKLLLLR